ncbi:MAG: hypothetical protein BMS9Abin02_0594 [Anaerolineae bacterium]|nr:MAG: hypothetical protein BMS9Abin02_0594 [Anaerolineae bacterium]
MGVSAAILVAGAAIIAATIVLLLIFFFVFGFDEIGTSTAITRASPQLGILAGADQLRATATVNEVRATNTQVLPTSTPQATGTLTVTPAPATSTIEPTPPTPTPTPRRINSLNQDEFIVLPDEVRKRIIQIHVVGQQIGRNAKAFSRLGTSIVDTRHFLGRWDEGPYDLGPFEYLEATVAYYSGSFSRIGEATQRGLSTWTVFNPQWADRDDCLANETMVDCEFRLHNPSILLIFLGTNDTGAGPTFEKNYRELINYVIDSGVIPVLVTKADRFEGRDNRNNKIIRELAAEYQIPLWDYDKLASTIPGRGLGGDKVHMTLFDRYDYAVPEAYVRGYGLFNLSALIMLDAIRNEIISAERSGEIPAQQKR